MANITQTELQDMILQHLVVLAVGQTANTYDAAIVNRAIESAYDRLNFRELVPFLLEAIPPWAQIPFRDYVAIDVSPSFGKPVDRMPDGTSPVQTQAKNELLVQVSGHKHRRRVRGRYY